MKYRIKLIQILSEDEKIFEILRIIRGLKLNDCWVGAGCIRNKVWDVLHEQTAEQFNDVDVIFFDQSDTSERIEKEIEEKLLEINKTFQWSVKNQARMHLRNNHSQYTDSRHAISHWPETATAVAAALNVNDEIEILAPYGLDDLFNLVVRPTPNFNQLIFQKRADDKQWENQWKKLTFIMD